MAATDSMPVAKKNTAFRHYFYLLDNTGAAITGATGLDSEVSKDGGSYADCTNEATEVAQGLYYLDLTSTEMNADAVAIVVKTSSANAIYERVIFAPEETGDIRTRVTQMADDVLTDTTPTTGFMDRVVNNVYNAQTGDHNDAGSFGEAIGTTKTKTDALPSDPAASSELTQIVNIGNAIAGYVDTEVAAIKAKTDNLPASPAAAGDIPSASTVASQVRTELTTELGRIDATVSSRLPTASYSAAPSAGTIADAVCDEALSGHTTAGTVGESLAAVYAAQIDFADDDDNSQDEYGVQWFKNGAPVTSGITVPTIQVIKRADGTDLVAQASMTQVGSSGAYKYDVTAALSRLSAGEAALVQVTATIDGATRTWRRWISRDAEIS
jgi:hypothetical protein